MSKIEYAELARKLWPFMAGYVGQLAGGTSVITASASSSPAGASAPAYGAYLTLGTDPTLTQERVFGYSGLGLSGNDGGAGGAYTLMLTSSSNPGAAASLLASDAAGLLTLPQFTATTKMRTPLIDTASGALTLTPATAVAITDGKTLNGSTTFVSGFAGTGWRVDQGVSYASQSTLEVDNVIVRGLMRVYELVINKIRVSRGSLIVSPGGGKVSAVSGSGPYTLTFDEDHGIAANDLLRAQKFTGSGTYQSLLAVTGVPTSKTLTVTLSSGNAPTVGYEYAVVGNSSNTTRQGGLFLTADDSGAPFMDIYDGVAAHTDFNSYTKTKARLGKLTGITDSFFGTLSGYGLYTSRAYLNGAYINGSLVIGPGVGFSVAPLFYLPLDAGSQQLALNTTGHKGQRAIISGVAEGIRGKFGSAGYIGSNLISNSSFEDGTTGWTHARDGSGTANNETANVYHGAKSYYITRTGGSYAYSYTAQIAGITGAAVYTLRAAVKKTAGAGSYAQITTWEYNSGGTFLGNGGGITFPTGTHDWRTQTTAYTTNASTAKIVVVVVVEGGDGTAVFDDIHLSKADAGALTYDSAGNLRGDTGTISAWIEVPQNTLSGLTDWQYVANYGAYSAGGTNQWLALYYSNNSGDVLRLGYSNGTGYVTTLDADITSMLSSPGWHHIAATWGATNGQKIYIDGGEAASATFTATPFVQPIGYSTFRVGPSHLGLSDFAILDRELSPLEVKTITSNGNRLNVTRSNYELMLTDPSTSAKVIAHAGGIFGTDAGAKPTFSLINVATTVNGESLTAGDTLLGDNSSGKGNVLFDQSAGALRIRTGTTDVLSFGSTGIIDGVLNLGASGGIWQGSGGSFASPGTGLKIYNTSSLGVLELWNSNAGILSLRPDNGLTILGGTGYVSRQSVNFVDSVGARLGEVYGYSDGSTYNAVRMQGYSNSASRAAAAFVQAAQEANGLAQIYIWASKFTSPSTLGQPNAYIYLESDQPNNQAVIQLQVRSTSTTSTFTLDQTGVTLTNGIKAFKIDHPLAPAEKWLYHNAIEGDGHFTFYRGNVTLDHSGRAVVQMPDWFDALNDGLVITYGAWGREVSDAPRTSHRIKNGWVIVGQPLQRVSWMASGERRDAWAARNPLQVESEKDDKDKGYVAAWREYGLEQSFEKPAAQAGAS